MIVFLFVNAPKTSKQVRPKRNNIIIENAPPSYILFKLFAQNYSEFLLGEREFKVIIIKNIISSLFSM